MDSLLENTWLIIIIGISFVFVMTSLGAALVFFFRKNISKNLNRIFLGFAAGVMIAASVWSLLIPAIESAEEQNIPGYIPAVIGFIAGGFFLLLIDKLLPHIHPRAGVQEGVKALSRERRCWSLQLRFIIFRKVWRSVYPLVWL